MAFFVYTKEDFLWKACLNLFGKKETLKQMNQTSDLTKPSSETDLLIVDLQAVDEEDLPDVHCAAMALASVPVHSQAIRLLQKGFRAYGNRHMHDHNLVMAVNAIKSGQIWLAPSIIGRMISTLPAIEKKKNHSLLKDLTPREVEVAKWVANGLSNSEISDKMFISVRTVKAHMSSIFHKTGCRDRLELATRLK
jgi:DNA-binding NarL/FixJ family response regulator